MLNSRDIHLLRQDVAANCQIWMDRCKSAGLPVLITNTVRDGEYQAYLYEQGRTRPGGIVTNSPTPTFHADHAGLAFDFCKNVKGQEYSDTAFFHAAAALAKEMGFSWGGDWKSFPDMPHIQWDNRGKWTSRQVQNRQYPPLMPLFEEEEETMTQETFNQLMEGYFNQLRQQPPSDWSKDAREWAEKNGLIQGNEQGEKAYKMFVTREQMAVLLCRLNGQK